MIDIWLIFAMLIPFCEVLLHTYMETLRNTDNDEDKDKEETNNTMGSKTLVVQSWISVFATAAKLKFKTCTNSDSPFEH